MSRGGVSFILAIVLVHMSHGVFSVGSENSQRLSNLFFRSRMASQDPAVTMTCFADYIEESNQVSEAYSGSYKQCLEEAKSGREGVEKKMANDRINIRSTSISVCKKLETCDNLTSTLDIFNCHAEIGANNTKAVYSISGNASEFASMMQEQYRIIDLKHEQCCKSAERKYVQETAVVYHVLQDCLGGRVAPTTTAPITTTAASPSSTTPTTTPVPTTTPTSITTPTTTPSTTSPTTTTLPTTTLPTTTTPTTTPTSTTTPSITTPSTTSPTTTTLPTTTTPTTTATSTTTPSITTPSTTTPATTTLPATTTPPTTTTTPKTTAIPTTTTTTIPTISTPTTTTIPTTNTPTTSTTPSTTPTTTTTTTIPKTASTPTTTTTTSVSSTTTTKGSLTTSSGNLKMPSDPSKFDPKKLVAQFFDIFI